MVEFEVCIVLVLDCKMILLDCVNDEYSSFKPVGSKMVSQVLAVFVDSFLLCTQ